MGATTGHSLRYPELDGEPPDLSTDLHNLDDDVNAALTNLIPDTGVLGNLTAVTPATGWTIQETQYRIIGPKMWLRIELTRTGAAITASSAGNFTDTDAATITDAAYWPSMDWYGVYRATLTGGSVRISSATGVVTLADAHSGSSISTGDNVYIYIPCPIAAPITNTLATIEHGLYYPELTDRPIGDDDNTQIMLAAEKIDAAISALIPDTGTRDDLPVSPAAGWTLLVAEYRLIGKDMSIHVWLQRDDTAITANATGNVAGDPSIFTIDDSTLRPSLDFIVGGFRASRTGGACQINSSGVCAIYDMHASSSISKNTDDQSSTVQVYANYPIP